MASQHLERRYTSAAGVTVPGSFHIADGSPRCFCVKGRWEGQARSNGQRQKQLTHFLSFNYGQKIGSQVGYFLLDLLSRSQNTGDANSLIIGRNLLVPIPSHRQSHPVGYGWGESLGILWRLKKKNNCIFFDWHWLILFD